MASNSPELTPRMPTPDMLIHVCLICGEPTGETSSARNHIITPGKIADANQHMYRRGLCAMHWKMIQEGHTGFYSDTRGVMLTLDANVKISPEFRGTVINIPEDKMDEILGKERPANEGRKTEAT
jgi:hypothetical protein